MDRRYLPRFLFRLPRRTLRQNMGNCCRPNTAVFCGSRSCLISEIPATLSLILRARGLGIYRAGQILLLYAAFNVVEAVLGYSAGRFSDRVGRQTADCGGVLRVRGRVSRPSRLRRRKRTIVVAFSALWRLLYLDAGNAAGVCGGHGGQESAGHADWRLSYGGWPCAAARQPYRRTVVLLEPRRAVLPGRHYSNVRGASAFPPEVREKKQGRSEISACYPRKALAGARIFTQPLSLYSSTLDSGNPLRRFSVV